jgi:hypothetical protein
LLIIGVAANFFFYIAVNLSMVMGMAPVVGVPLPLLLWRVGDAGAAGRLWPGAKRPCPPAALNVPVSPPDTDALSPSPWG